MEQPKQKMSFKKELVELQEELYRFAFRLTSDREDANDLLQETSLKALDNEDKYTTNENFRGWLYTIMRNLFLNSYRRLVYEQTFTDQTEERFYTKRFDQSVFENTENYFDLKEIRHVMGSLSVESRLPFAMYVSGFKYREIAEKLHIPIGTVKSRICITRRKLQKALRDFR